MCTKICNGCKKELPLSEFHLQNGKPRSKCKACRRLEKEEYVSRPHVREKLIKYYQEHKLEIRKRTGEHYWTLVGQFHQYKKRAKKDNISFELTKEDCKPFYKTTCVYCGDTITGLGIDRVDNTKGYILSNCVPCCKTCNWMKRAQTKEEFFQQIKKIYSNITK